NKASLYAIQPVAWWRIGRPGRAGAGTVAGDNTPAVRGVVAGDNEVLSPVTPYVNKTKAKGNSPTNQVWGHRDIPIEQSRMDLWEPRSGGPVTMNILIQEKQRDDGKSESVGETRQVGALGRDGVMGSSQEGFSLEQRSSSA